MTRVIEDGCRSCNSSVVLCHALQYVGYKQGCCVRCADVGHRVGAPIGST